MNRPIFIVLTIICTVSLYSCKKESAVVNLEAQSVILGSEMNAQSSISIDANGDWEIWNTSDWYKVSSEHGTGPMDVTVTALTENEDLIERVATMVVASGEGNRVIYIIQRGSKGIGAYKETYGGHAEKGECIVMVEGNLEEEDITVTSSEQWITFKELRQGVKDVLDDGKTESLYGEVDLVFDMEANTSADFRTADVQIKTEDETYSFKVTQISQSDVDYDAQFYKNTLIAKYTATSCTYCPGMERILKQVVEEIPDRIIPLNIHPMHSGEGLGFEGADQLMKKFNVSGYPTAFANYIAEIPNTTNKDNVKTGFEEVTKEAISSYPAKTAIKASSETDGTNLDINIEIAMKESLDYKLTVYVVEDGIIYKQVDDGELVLQYEHNHILRSAVSDIMGDEFPFAMEDGICRMTYSCAVPGNINNMENAYLLVFVTYPGVPEVRTAEYVTYTEFGLIVDNVVTLGLNDEIGYRYE